MGQPRPNIYDTDNRIAHHYINWQFELQTDLMCVYESSSFEISSFELIWYGQQWLLLMLCYKNSWLHIMILMSMENCLHNYNNCRYNHMYTYRSQKHPTLHETGYNGFFRIMLKRTFLLYQITEMNVAFVITRFRRRTEPLWGQGYKPAKVWDIYSADH